jgi:N-acetylmuramoyl-L-alanine amidase
MSLRAALLATLAVALLGAGVRPAGLGDVTGVAIQDEGSHTRVVIRLSRPAPFLVQSVGHPARLYVDVGSTWIEAPQREVRPAPPGGPVLRVRGGQNTLETARVVLELDGDGRGHRAFQLQDPPRIVVDVYREAEAAPPEPGFDLRPVQRVIIDPGHGGKDPGAIGVGGLREKDVVLGIARRLRATLIREGLEVHLTRDGDRFLTLEDRTRLANRLHGDLFVSIHANASRNRRTTGVETYLLDTRYDRQTARVAARENGTTIAELDDLQLILASLRLGYSERYAARLARHVHDGIAGRLRGTFPGMRDLGVKRGPFLVLFQADMPAILVEVGFLSNRTEASRMRTDAFSRAAADGIARGILAHRGEHARHLVAERF